MFRNKEKTMDKPDRQIRPYALKEGEGWVYRFGIDFTLKASEAQNSNGAAFLEYRTEQGEEPPDHTHQTEDEMFYVLEGSVTFRCGEETFEVEKGGFIFLPAGIEHGYTIRSEDPVRLIAVTAPGRDPGSKGWGGFVSDMELVQGELISKPGHAEF
jgi:quercetin dioxygenase-like cupin family protein